MKYFAVLLDSAGWRDHSNANQHIFDITINTFKKTNKQTIHQFATKRENQTKNNLFFIPEARVATQPPTDENSYESIAKPNVFQNFYFIYFNKIVPGS